MLQVESIGRTSLRLDAKKLHVEGSKYDRSAEPLIENNLDLLRGSANPEVSQAFLIAVEARKSCVNKSFPQSQGPRATG